jgi:hypothetical protein
MIANGASRRTDGVLAPFRAKQFVRLIRGAFSDIELPAEGQCHVNQGQAETGWRAATHARSDQPESGLKTRPIFLQEEAFVS